MAAVTICSDLGAQEHKVCNCCFLNCIQISQEAGKVVLVFILLKPDLKNFEHYFEMKVKEESEKVGLKLNIQKIKIMPSDPITSWQIDGENVEAVTDFVLLG